MEFNHKPVLLSQVIEGLKIKSDGTYVDGTVGGAGHSKEIADRLDRQGRLICLDRDMEALKAARERLAGQTCKIDFFHSNYGDAKTLFEEEGIGKVDGVLLDLGVSSFQLDTPRRGFSYMQDAPLDMRMDGDDDSALTAEEIVNEYSQEDLHRIIKEYGEERWAKRIAEFIVKEREQKRLTSTSELVAVIKKAIPKKARIDGPHPAKRTFQALRIEVNGELARLGKAVDDFIDILAPGGRLAVISFHSLEDRIVKEVFAKRLKPCTCPPDLPKCVCGKTADVKKVTGKPIMASREEVEENPRSRSAKLRIIEKL